MATVEHDIEYYLEAARELAGKVAAAADRIDGDRQLPSELAGEMADRGFFRLRLPRSLGGAQLDHPDFLRILEIFAAVDASTGWCLNQNNVFSTSSLRMPEQTAREIWAEKRAVVTNGPPTASSQAVPVNGGYKLNGRWHFSSGSSHATWIAALAPISNGGSPAQDASKDRTGALTRAEVRIKERKADEFIVNASATVRALIPGFRFTLEEHPIQAFNREYVLTRIEHEATQPESAEEDSGGSVLGTQHKTELRLIPSDVIYRPPRKTERATVQGSQTAMVVGRGEEEIDCDEYGRGRVRFHWDLDSEKTEDCSFWIRVSNNWAGGNYGIMFLPRIGQEVIVDFLEGDPDQPIITGRVYNNDNMPPYKLPDEKTKSPSKCYPPRYECPA